MEKFLNLSRALCLSPHPDDVEYSMGGTARKYGGTFFDVVCLSRGGDRDRTAGEERIEEVKAFWTANSCDNVAVHFPEIGHVKDLSDDLWVNLLETRYLQNQNYDVIFTPSASDSHFEHRIANRLGPPLSRLEKIAIVEYCSPSTLDDWIPNLFVDIHDEFEHKLQALGEFKSQICRKYFSETTIRNFNTNFRCSKRGVHYVEQFKIKQIYE
ncbi:PIG-L family deacetylase [Mycolicibacterium sp.]|uniref:PIG-L deacetylase family protein n=1 Tax=Mycolicibacterium sp. TaxID=2320850 RepID=UPI0025DD3BE7|nr:PIG-L family deacetylase [Mycolicibacterium sp.]MCB9409861.1 PIG-L family deacetylase [Mycolicibacterium sp.]